MCMACTLAQNFESMSCTLTDAGIYRVVVHGGGEGGQAAWEADGDRTVHVRGGVFGICVCVGRFERVVCYPYAYARPGLGDLCAVLSAC